MALHFKMATHMPVPAHQLFSWHERRGAFERLTPPWQRLDIVYNSGSLLPGSYVIFKAYYGPFFITWKAEHIHYDKNREFIDTQKKGPFKTWVHHHITKEKNATTSILKDSITYTLPMKHINIGKCSINTSLKQLFAYRHKTLHTDLYIQNKYCFKKPLKIAITGSSGTIGQCLSAFLTTAGHCVIPITRKKITTQHIFWDINRQFIENDKLENIDAVINLCGENIGQRKWSAQQKERIYNSRILSTRLLANALNTLKSPPHTLISASAIGYYGKNAQHVKNENQLGGNDFLATVCEKWEQAAQHFTQGRVVNPRFGIVLTPKGGALKKMLPVFRAGLGGQLGSGSQIMSWISIDDLIYTLYHILYTHTLSGPINITSPHSVSNRLFTQTLGQILKRPYIFSIPEKILKIIFGEMAEGTLLADINAIPSKLLKSGFTFQYDKLETTLRHLLGTRDINSLEKNIL
tara:strand:+ start:4161 stop:5552 length:1392 start_codon:yes stop_codon:yes gene_type:complete